MTSQSAMTETIRIRIEPEKKEKLTRIYQSRGTSISQAVRNFFDAELATQVDPISRLDAIFGSVDAKLDNYGAPEPSVQDIVDYVEGVREARAVVAV
jgi:hypothetical protein